MGDINARRTRHRREHWRRYPPPGEWRGINCLVAEFLETEPFIEHTRQREAVLGDEVLVFLVDSDE